MGLQVLHGKEKNMFKTKLLAGVLLIFMLLAAQVGVAAAAPLAQGTTPISGTIQSITTETDANGVTTVLVTLTDGQTVRISDVTADELGLFDLTTQEPVLTQIGQPVVIDPTTVIPDEEPTEEDVHPIAALLAAFFDEDPSIVDGYHEDGFGFGVIAQALWISRNLTGTEDETGDASLTEKILQAKEDRDYSAFTDYFEDGSLPTNWGQFKKEVLQKKNNLGVIVSGQADTETVEQLQDEQVQEKNGNGHGKDKNNGKGEGKKNK
jgi:hypothetical protein